MRIAILADIHGNLPALQAVLNDINQPVPDGVIVAGDFIGGPQPNETIRLLRSMRSWMIRGNSDENVLRFTGRKAPAAWQDSHQWALMRWTCQHLDRDNLEFLGSLPYQRVVTIDHTASIRVAHGSHCNLSEQIYPERDPGRLTSLLSQVEEPVYICGHTHIPWKFEQAGRLALNPGAVCGPLDGYVGAEYAVLLWEQDRWQVEFHQVPYDLGQIRKDFQESGLLDEAGGLARAFLASIETGRNIAEDFLTYAYQLADEMGYQGCEVVPDAIWDEAAESFNWV
jgi:putative phosphoesterase